MIAACSPHLARTPTDTVSEGLWRRASELGCELDLPTHAHVAQSIEEVRFSLDRRGSAALDLAGDDGSSRWGVRHGPSPTASMYPATSWHFSILGGDTLVFCPHSQLVFGFPADPLTWGEAGVPWVAATDCSPSNDSMNLQKELRFLAARSGQCRQRGRRGTGVSLADGDPADAEAAWAARGESFERAAADAGAESLLSRVWHLPGSIHPAFRVGEIGGGDLGESAGMGSGPPRLLAR